jgi:hypothetical protein
LRMPSAFYPAFTPHPHLSKAVTPHYPHFPECRSKFSPHAPDLRVVTKQYQAIHDIFEASQ